MLGGALRVQGPQQPPRSPSHARSRPGPVRPPGRAELLAGLTGGLLSPHGLLGLELRSLSGPRAPGCLPSSAPPPLASQSEARVPTEGQLLGTIPPGAAVNPGRSELRPGVPAAMNQGSGPVEILRHVPRVAFERLEVGLPRSIVSASPSVPSQRRATCSEFRGPARGARASSPGDRASVGSSPAPCPGPAPRRASLRASARYPFLEGAVLSPCGPEALLDPLSTSSRQGPSRRFPGGQSIREFFSLAQRPSPLSPTPPSEQSSQGICQLVTVHPRPGRGVPEH